MTLSRTAWWLRRNPTPWRFLPAPHRAAAMIGACALLAACQTFQQETSESKATGTVPDVPVTQGRYVVGEPYRENGVWYHPAEDWTYNEVGVASWYGIDHHGKRTANGETFDLRALTAAHPTLPLPSRVRVTNIENGRSVEVRVNDRGPFVDGRLIDLSRRAAEILGFKEDGTARVRVEMLGRAPLEMFRMAKADKGPDLPTRAAPSAEVKAAALPSPEEAAEDSREEADETETAAMDERRPPEAPEDPETPEDPVGELIDRITAKAETENADAGKVEAEGEGTGEGENAAAEEEASPSGSVNRRFFIQAGAFTVPENAYSLRRLIMKAITGATVSINPAQVGNREFFRVRVGPFASTEEAKGILAQIRNLGQNDAEIVRD
ncbi:MAG: septal ring lytic transglycosylase RlpA family protein [bacterium]